MLEQREPFPPTKESHLPLKLAPQKTCYFCEFKGEGNMETKEAVAEQQ